MKRTTKVALFQDGSYIIFAPEGNQFRECEAEQFLKQHPKKVNGELMAALPITAELTTTDSPKFRAMMEGVL